MDFDNSRPDPAMPPAPHRGRGTGLLVTVALCAGLIGGGVGAGAGVGVVTLGAPLLARAEAMAAPVVLAVQPAAQVTGGANIAGAVYQKAGGAVVEIIVSSSTGRGNVQSGNGTGFVVDAKGLVVTNNHVVEGARTITVRFADGATKPGTVLGTDSNNDLALVKVDLPANTPVAQLGNSDGVQVGDVAIAIGSPFGLDQSVTEGIISAVNRDWQPSGGRISQGLIQTDAAVNPGNSGGPLLNANGEVIGITSMIESPVRGSVGVGFAIPINLAKNMIPQLESGAQIQAVWLGITGTQLDETLATQQGLTVKSGVLVISVVADSPASKAGVQGGQAAAGNPAQPGQGQGQAVPAGGDVITAVDGKAVSTVAQITAQISSHKPGDTIQVTILRGGQEQQLSVTLAARPATQS